MRLGEQEALLAMWMDFLEGRPPSASLMREFYFAVVSQSRLYRYGMAPELFDLLVNGIFEVRDSIRWSKTPRQVAAGTRAA